MGGGKIINGTLSCAVLHHPSVQALFDRDVEAWHALIGPQIYGPARHGNLGTAWPKPSLMLTVSTANHLWQNVHGKMFTANLSRQHVHGKMITAIFPRQNVRGKMFTAKCSRQNVQGNMFTTQW